MANVNGVLNLYLFSLMFVSISIYLLGLYLQKHSITHRFFFLPAIHLFCATTFIFIQLNIVVMPVTDPTTLTALSVVMYVVDATSTVALSLAFFFRLRLIVITAQRTNSIPRWLGHLSWVLIIPGLVFPISSIIGIACLFSEYLQDQQGLCEDITNAANIFYSVTETCFHLLFGFALCHHASLAPFRVRMIWIVSSILLAMVSIGEVTGAIISFFEPDIGVAITYCCWLINNSAFLLMNRLVTKKLKSY